MIIEIENLSAGYGRDEVLTEFSACIPAGKITAVLGPNGSGKSTMLKTIAGLCKKRAGEIYLKGRRKEEYSDRKFAEQVFYLAQNQPSLAIRTERLVLHGRFPYLSYPRHYSRRDYECCERAMERTGILEYRDKRLNELSGGQRQKAYLAMALAGGQELLLFDEPTTWLDIRYQTELFGLLQELRDSGTSIAAVLHDLDYALRLADWILLMKDGRLILQGTPQEIWESGLLEEVYGISAGCAVDENGGIHYYFR